MDGQLIPFLSQKKGHRQNETHQEELDWIKHPSSRIHLLKHTLKPQPKNMNIRWLVSLEQIHQQSRNPSSLVLDLTGALIRLFKDIERAVFMGPMGMVSVKVFNGSSLLLSLWV